MKIISIYGINFHIWSYDMQFTIMSSTSTEWANTLRLLMMAKINSKQFICCFINFLLFKNAFFMIVFCVAESLSGRILMQLQIISIVICRFFIVLKLFGIVLVMRILIFMIIVKHGVVEWFLFGMIGDIFFNEIIIICIGIWFIVVVR